MTEIRAFIGHSFTDEDSELVGKFLKYFEQISRSHTDFFWNHAESAEPKQLAEKVMSIISDKNLFIGICTRKEYVLDPNSLSTVFFRQQYNRAPKTAFYWKTSDWIIQEIGLAMGRGLDLILLIESGVRKPGGLQGDVEYISFDRASPEKSFGKILDMITALSPRAPSSVAKTSDMTRVPDEEPQAPPPSEGQNWWVPKPDWTRQQYEMTYMMVVDVNEADAQTISRAYLATDDAAQGDNRNSWQAFCEFIRLRFGVGGSLPRLKELAAAHPHSSGTLRYLARGFEVYQDYETLARTYEAAAKEANEASERLQLLKDAAVAYVRAGAPEAASAVIAEMKTHFQTNRIGELELLNALRAYMEIDKDNDPIVALMERIADIDPSDTNARFSLAYKHSEIGNNDLALFHYKRIPSEERTAIAWNNLGVAFNNLDLTANAIVAYRKAEQMGETLAMSNIAEKLMAAGFLPEAQQECEDALRKDNYHKGVVTTLARLKSVRDVENEKESSILLTVKPISDFYIRVGRAMCRSKKWDISKKWKGPDCVLEVTTRGIEFLAVGSYERRNLLGLATAFGSLGNPAPEHYQIEYRGTSMPGGVIKARVTRTRKGDTPAVNSLLGSRDNESTVIMIITDAQNEIHVMETAKGASARFYALTREERA